MKKFYQRNFRIIFGSILTLILGSWMITLISIARGPEKDLHFLRETESTTTLTLLSGALQNTAFWPNWFYSLEKVTRLTPDGQEVLPPTPVTQDSTLRLYFNDRKSPWSAMQITAQVLEATPTHLVLNVLHDTKGKLTRLFNHLEWEIELLPSSSTHDSTPRIRVIGKAQAHTSHWRSRLFGTVTEKILMNQVFHPNVMQLAKIRSLTPLGPQEKNTPPAISSSDALLSIPSLAAPNSALPKSEN